MTEQNNQFRIDKQLARRAFDRAADTYDGVAELQCEIGDRLIERLDYIRQQPRRILDLGAGTGFFTAALLKRYRKADVVALDIAERMLQRVQGRGGWFRRCCSGVAIWRRR
jgi:malonyl-CoA O-methyltransferase